MFAVTGSVRRLFDVKSAGGAGRAVTATLMVRVSSDTVWASWLSAVILGSQADPPTWTVFDVTQARYVTPSFFSLLWRPQTR